MSRYRYRTRKERPLSYFTLQQFFHWIHLKAAHGLLLPLRATLSEWLEPLIKESARRYYDECKPHLSSLKAICPAIDLTPRSTSFQRLVSVEHPRPVTWYSDEAGPMLRAKATLVIVHPPTFGEQYFRDILGDAGLAVLEHLTPHEIGGLVAPDWVAEAVEYTRQHMENLYSMLPEWTKQFKDVGGAVEGTENYHRIAAAIYYSPVIAGWAQHMKSSVNLAPQCLTLRRTNRFKYETPMPDALHSALSTALTLAQTKDPTP